MLNLRAAKPDAILSGAYPAPAVLLAQKYGEFGMTHIPLMQSTQGMPTPSVYAKNVGNPDALKNLYHTWAFIDIVDEALRKRLADQYRKNTPGREPGPFMVTGVPSAMAVIDTLRRLGTELTRERFVDAMEQLNLSSDLMTGPLQFGPGRRDALRSVVVVKFDGKTQKVMPGTYSWNGKDGT